MERVAAVLLLSLAASGCAGSAASSPAAETARAWGAGPARWLLLPDERDRLAAVRTNTDFTTFLVSFWSCRNDESKGTENVVGKLFAERVAAADRLYEEPGLRGSLTPRGGALVLLGPPHFLRYSQRRAPTLEGTTTAGARATRLLKVEIWGYQPSDLPVALRNRLGSEAAADGELAVTFLVSDRHTKLLEGQDLLDMAAETTRHCAATGR